MPLPELAMDYLIHAAKYLNRRGWLHIYLHIEGRSKEDARRNAEIRVIDGATAIFNITKMQSRVVRSIGSRTFQVVVDAFGEANLR